MSVTAPLSAERSLMKTPPERAALLFTGAPAPRAVLDDWRAPRFLWGNALLPFLGQCSDAHFPARPLDARTRGLGGFFNRLVVGMVLLLALGAAAQASRGVQVSGSGSSGTHGSIPFTWASRPSASRAASSTRSPRGRCDRCTGGRASDAAPRRAERRAAPHPSPARAPTIRDIPAPRRPRPAPSPVASPGPGPA